MTGIIVSSPPNVEVPPGSNASNPSSLPSVTYTYAVTNVPQTWTALQTFGAGKISIQSSDIIGISVAAASNQWVNSIVAGVPVLSQPAFSNISGTATLAQLPTLGASTVLGSIAGGTPVALTTTQHTTLVNTFTSVLSGAVPASGGGTTNFLRADGTFASPAGSGTVTNVATAGLATGGAITTTGTITVTAATGAQAAAGSSSTVAVTPAALATALGYGYFVVNRNGSNQTGATANTFNKIQFTTEVVDSQSFFDNATNYRFQPTQAGWYQIFLTAGAAAMAAGPPQSAIYKNGVVSALGTYAGGTTAGTVYTSVSALIQLNGSTDYIEGFMFLPTGTTTIDGTASTTFMFGYRIA